MIVCRKIFFNLLFLCFQAIGFSLFVDSFNAFAEEPIDENKASDREANSDFDKIQFEKEINYALLSSDGGKFSLYSTPPIDSPVFLIFHFLRNNDYEGAIRQSRENIEKLLAKRSPWNTGSDNIFPETGNCGVALTQNVYALAIALELNGDYDEAMVAYGVVFATDYESLLWTAARIHYSRVMRDKEKPDNLGIRDRVWSDVVNAIQDNHNLSEENVDGVIRKARETEKAFAEGKAYYLSQTGLPVMADSHDRRDQEALEIYRLRDWCARIVCPKLHFTYMSLYTASPHNPERIDLIELTRKSYDEFVDFMEEEYSKRESKLSVETVEGRRALDTMTLLRKMKELPY